MALDATLSRWGITIPRGWARQREAGVVTHTLRALVSNVRPRQTRASHPKTATLQRVDVRCNFVQSRRPLGGVTEPLTEAKTISLLRAHNLHGHPLLLPFSRLYHLPYPGPIFFNGLINASAESPLLRHNSVQVCSCYVRHVGLDLLL